MVAAVVKVISILTIVLCLTSANNLLLQYDNNYCRYPCPEDILVFLCSVNVGGATIWKGSIFNCPRTGNEIALRHSALENAAGTCNDGNIVAYNIDVTNNTHSSQLNVTVSPEMHNEMVECIHDTLNATSVLVRTYTLVLTTEPPGDIHVSDISPNQLTIRWSPASLISNCPLATYDIATTGCGKCPNTTSDTFIRCTNLTIFGRKCSIVIQTKACRRVGSEHSGAANLTIALSVPGAPEVTARWMNQFTSILTSFNTTEQFFISDGIDGSATSYTIIYSVSDSTSERTFDSVIIPASACTQQICAHTLKINQSSPCLLSSGGVSIIITVFATNVLGKGPISDPVVLIIPEQDDDREISGVTLILIATILIIILLMVSAVSVLIIMVIVLLRRNLQIKKELVKAKESSTYEEIDISAPASSIDTAENISYCSVSRKYKHASSTHAQCH